MRIIVGVVVLSFAVAGAARATEVRPSSEPPDPGVAQGLSVLGTLGGWGLFMAGTKLRNGPLAWAGAAGIAVGPSVGHFYAGEPGRGLLTAGLRAAGEAAFVAGVFGLFSGGFLSNDEPAPGWAAPMLLGGLVTIGATTLWDIIDARRAAVRERDRRTVVVAPAPVVGPQGSVSAGLAVAGRF